MKNGIDPRLVTIFGIWTSILMMIAGFGPSFFDSCILTGGAAFSASTPGPFVGKQISATPTVVKVLLAAFALSMFLPTAPVAAAPLKKLAPLAVTGNPVKDFKTDLNNAGVSTVPKVAGGNLAQCDFNIFAALDPQNVVNSVQNCVSAVNTQFLPDVAAALASAQAYGDDTGVQCLKPALAIVQAAVGTLAVPAKEAVPATATSPEIPAVAAVSAQTPGVILIFQKFREFTLAGGPTACQNWVKTTVNGVNPL
jgi:hypothetical protein